MHSNRIFCSTLLCAVVALAPPASKAAQPGPPATVAMVAGNGQVVQPNFPATMPLTILVTDALGIPVPGVPVSWSTLCGASDYGCNSTETGTLEQPSNQTDSNGMATTNYDQVYVPPEESYTQATIMATTPIGSVNFKVTATAPFSGTTLPVSVYIEKPGPLGTITGPMGSTLPGALQVSVSPGTGFFAGQGIPNVGVRIVDAGTGMSTPAASCNAPGGIVLTDTTGVATCDVVLGNTPGTYSLAARVGEQQNPPFDVVITAAQFCTYSISPTSANYPVQGGGGQVNVTADPGCTWTVTSNASFIQVTPGASGVSSGAVSYTVGANPGTPRSGTISIAGQTFTVNQSGAAPPALTITSSATLPGAVQNAVYSTTLTASGGTGTYTWAVSSGALPPGLTLTVSQNQGVISGTPTTVGNYPFTITVSDTGGSSQSQAFTIGVGAAGSTLTILTTSAANGIVGTPYLQPLSYSQPASANCGGPFSSPAFTVTGGGLPPGLSIQNNAITGTPTSPGTYPFTIIVGNSYCQSAPVSLSIFINGSGASTILSANPGSLTFNAAVTGTAPASQVVVVSSTGSSVTLSAAANVTWLSLALSPSATPAALTVSLVNYQSLPPGVYQGIVTVVTSSSNSSLTIPVTMNLAGGPPAVGLTVSASSVSFNLPANSYSQQVITLLGGASNSNVAFLATAATSTGVPWLGLVLVAGNAPVSSIASTTPANLGVTVNTTGLPPGTYTGSIVIQQQGTNLTLTVQVNMVVAQNTLTVDMQSLAFTYSPGVTPPAPLTINLSSNSPVPVIVTAVTAAGGNWLFASAAAPSGPAAGVTTPTAITVSVNPTGLERGTYNGTITITPQVAGIAPLTVPVTLTIQPGAGPTINGVVNSASNIAGPISPGEFITIYGSSMGSTTPTLLTLTSAGTISNSLNGTQVLFDGLAAPLVYVSATQINAIVPYEVYGRVSTQIQVSYNGALSSTVNEGVSPSAPGIFLCLSCQPSNQAAALNQDNTPNSATNGALPTSTVTLFATGEGQTNPAGTTGTIVGTTLAQPLLPVLVQIGGLPATVTYYGSAPSLAEGILQVNVQIPAGVPRGASVPVILTVGTAMSNTASIAIAH